MPVISGLMRSRMTSATDGGQQPAEELDQAGADEVAHAFDVGHDARDQLAGFVGVVVGDRQPPDVLLDFLAQFGDHLLAFDREQLSERERRDALHGGGAHHGQRQAAPASMPWCLPMTLSIRILRGIGEHKAAQAADDDQQEAEARMPAARLHQRPDIGPEVAQTLGAGFFGAWGVSRVIPLFRCVRPLAARQTILELQESISRRVHRSDCRRRQCSSRGESCSIRIASGRHVTAIVWKPASPLLVGLIADQVLAANFLADALRPHLPDPSA